jgi:hypothetical protein
VLLLVFLPRPAVLLFGAAEGSVQNVPSGAEDLWHVECSMSQWHGFQHDDVFVALIEKISFWQTWSGRYRCQPWKVPGTNAALKDKGARVLALTQRTQ